MPAASGVQLSPDTGDAGQLRKCRNRECKNMAGQPLKPRSPYCSKRCQAREQNMRQGRIKGHSKRPHLLNLLERQRQNISETELADICGGPLDVVNYSESVGNHLSLCMLNGRPVLVNIKIDDKADKLDKVLPTDAFLVTPKNLSILNIHSPENRESERALKEMYGLSPTSSMDSPTSPPSSSPTTSVGGLSLSSGNMYMSDFAPSGSQRVMLPPIHASGASMSSVRRPEYGSAAHMGSQGFGVMNNMGSSGSLGQIPYSRSYTSPRVIGPGQFYQERPAINVQSL